MKHIALIIGARPNFMKAFPVYEALKNDFNLTLIHTGQHFDEKMSKVFFEQLKFPYPDIHLTLDKRTKAGDFDDKLYVNNSEYLKNKDLVIKDLIEYQGELGQMGEIRDKLKNEFEHLKPDSVIVFGDVTSTLAASLSAKSLKIDIAHVESGLRSGDMKMPEEVNRILTDHISNYYFVTEQSGVDNLEKEGITENVYLVGNTMIDTQKKYLQQALNTKYHEILGLKSKEYVLITLHRPINVDNLDKLKEIFDDLEELSKTDTLVYPIHPRTKKNLKKLGYLQKVIDNKNIILEEPLGYLEFTCLIANCKYVITDSGGIQEETTALNIPCFTLRENTERPSTLVKNKGTSQLISKINNINKLFIKPNITLKKNRIEVSQNIKNILLLKKKYKVDFYNIIGDENKHYKKFKILATCEKMMIRFKRYLTDYINLEIEYISKKNINTNNIKNNELYLIFHRWKSFSLIGRKNNLLMSMKENNNNYCKEKKESYSFLPKEFKKILMNNSNSILILCTSINGSEIRDFITYRENVIDWFKYEGININQVKIICQNYKIIKHNIIKSFDSQYYVNKNLFRNSKLDQLKNRLILKKKKKIIILNRRHNWERFVTTSFINKFNNSYSSYTLTRNKFNLNDLKKKKNLIFTKIINKYNINVYEFSQKLPMLLDSLNKNNDVDWCNNNTKLNFFYDNSLFFYYF